MSVNSDAKAEAIARVVVLDADTATQAQLNYFIQVQRRVLAYFTKAYKAGVTDP